MKRFSFESKILYLLLENKEKRETIVEHMGEYFLVFQICFEIVKMHLSHLCIS